MCVIISNPIFKGIFDFLHSLRRKRHRNSDGWGNILYCSTLYNIIFKSYSILNNPPKLSKKGNTPDFSHSNHNSMGKSME